MSGSAAVVAAHCLDRFVDLAAAHELDDSLDEDATVVLRAEDDHVEALDEHGETGERQPAAMSSMIGPPSRYQSSVVLMSSRSPNVIDHSRDRESGTPGGARHMPLHEFGSSTPHGLVPPRVCERPCLARNFRYGTRHSAGPHPSVSCHSACFASSRRRPSSSRARARTPRRRPSTTAPTTAAAASGTSRRRSAPRDSISDRADRGRILRRHDGEAVGHHGERLPVPVLQAVARRAISRTS